MATLKVQNAIAAGFPAGTNVGAYALKGPQTVTPASGAPSGSAVETVAVSSEGTLEYTGLTEGTYYLLAAEVSGAWRYVHVYVDRTGEVQVIATQATGDFAVMTAGKGFRVKEGSNAKMGTATLVAGKVTVANTSVTASSKIFLSGRGATAKAGALSVTARTAGTSFAIESTNAEDVREVDYLIFEPA